jgi:hypothetical protein
MAASRPEPTITPLQLLNLLAPKEHRPILEIAPKVGMFHSYYTYSTPYLSWPGVERNGSENEPQISFTVAGGEILLPRAPTLQADAPRELVEEITQWVNFQLGAAKDFGRVIDVVTRLESICTSKSQLRYVWPPIVSLCKVSEDTKQLAEEMAELKTPKNPPSLNSELREACRQAATTVTSAMFFEEPEQPKAVQVTINFTQLTYKEPHGRFYAMS